MPKPKKIAGGGGQQKKKSKERVRRQVLQEAHDENVEVQNEGEEEQVPELEPTQQEVADLVVPMDVEVLEDNQEEEEGVHPPLLPPISMDGILLKSQINAEYFPSITSSQEAYYSSGQGEGVLTGRLAEHAFAEILPRIDFARETGMAQSMGLDKKASKTKMYENTSWAIGCRIMFAFITGFANQTTYPKGTFGNNLTLKLTHAIQRILFETKEPALVASENSSTWVDENGLKLLSPLQISQIGAHIPDVIPCAVRLQRVVDFLYLKADKHDKSMKECNHQVKERPNREERLTSKKEVTGIEKLVHPGIINLVYKSMPNFYPDFPSYPDDEDFDDKKNDQSDEEVKKLQKKLKELNLKKEVTPSTSEKKPEKRSAADIKKEIRDIEWRNKVPLLRPPTKESGRHPAEYERVAAKIVEAVINENRFYNIFHNGYLYTADADCKELKLNREPLTEFVKGLLNRYEEIEKEQVLPLPTPTRSPFQFRGSPGRGGSPRGRGRGLNSQTPSKTSWKSPGSSSSGSTTTILLKRNTVIKAVQRQLLAILAKKNVDVIFVAAHYSELMRTQCIKATELSAEDKTKLVDERKVSMKRLESWYTEVFNYGDLVERDAANQLLEREAEFDCPLECITFDGIYSDQIVRMKEGRARGLIKDFSCVGGLDEKRDIIGVLKSAKLSNGLDECMLGNIVRDNYCELLRSLFIVEAECQSIEYLSHHLKTTISNIAAFTPALRLSEVGPKDYIEKKLHNSIARPEDAPYLINFTQLKYFVTVLVRGKPWSNDGSSQPTTCVVVSYFFDPVRKGEDQFRPHKTASYEIKDDEQLVPKLMKDFLLEIFNDKLRSPDQTITLILSALNTKACKIDQELRKLPSKLGYISYHFANNHFAAARALKMRRKCIEKKALGRKPEDAEYEAEAVFLMKMFAHPIAALCEVFQQVDWKENMGFDAEMLSAFHPMIKYLGEGPAVNKILRTIEFVLVHFVSIERPFLNYMVQHVFTGNMLKFCPGMSSRLAEILTSPKIAEDIGVIAHKNELVKCVGSSTYDNMFRDIKISNSVQQLENFVDMFLPISPHQQDQFKTCINNIFSKMLFKKEPGFNMRILLVGMSQMTQAQKIKVIKNTVEIMPTVARILNCSVHVATSVIFYFDLYLISRKDKNENKVSLISLLSFKGSNSVLQFLFRHVMNYQKPSLYDIVSGNKNFTNSYRDKIKLLVEKFQQEANGIWIEEKEAKSVEIFKAMFEILDKMKTENIGIIEAERIGKNSKLSMILMPFEKLMLVLHGLIHIINFKIDMQFETVKAKGEIKEPIIGLYCNNYVTEEKEVEIDGVKKKVPVRKCEKYNEYHEVNLTQVAVKPKELDKITHLETTGREKVSGGMIKKK